MMFIYAIYPTSFRYGILLNVMSKCFADFTEQDTYNDRHNGEFNKYSIIIHSALYTLTV